MNFSSCSDHSWIINDCYIFFPYLRVSVFLFLRNSFFTAQHLGPMVHLIQFSGEWGFCWRGFSSLRNFFSYSLVYGMDIGYVLSSNPKNIYFYRRHSWGQTFHTGLLITDHLVFLYYLLTSHQIKCADLRLREEYPFRISDLIGYPIKPQYTGLIN